MGVWNDSAQNKFKTASIRAAGSDDELRVAIGYSHWLKTKFEKREKQLVVYPDVEQCERMAADLIGVIASLAEVDRQSQDRNALDVEEHISDIVRRITPRIKEKYAELFTRRGE